MDFGDRQNQKIAQGFYIIRKNNKSIIEQQHM